MERFSLLLIPRALLAARRAALHYLCFLPVDSPKDGRQWISLCSDRNRVQMFSMSTSPERANWFHLDEVTTDVFGREISFTAATKQTSTYTFGSNVEVQLWEDAVHGKGGDPLFHFVSSLPHVLRCAECAPAEVLAQLSELLAAPDMDLLHALLMAAAARGHEVAKPAVLAALARANDAGLLAPWFRAVFSVEIRLLRSVQTIFRESSAASISSAAFLVCAGADFTRAVAEILLQGDGALDGIVRQVVAAVGRMPPALRVVFGACFRATRRRFKEGLVPLLAVSSFLMLRFLLPQLAVLSPAAGKLGQRLMSVFVFKPQAGEQLGDDLPPLIARFLLEITDAEEAKVLLPAYDGMRVLQFCAENAALVADRLDLAKGEDEYLLHWSVLEMIETAVFGAREDWGKFAEGCTFLD